MFWLSVKNVGRSGTNSLATGAKISEVMIGQRLSNIKSQFCLEGKGLGSGKPDGGWGILSVNPPDPSALQHRPGRAMRSPVPTRGPSKSYDDEQLPLVPAHANLLDGMVQHPGLGLVDGVDLALGDDGLIVEAEGYLFADWGFIRGDLRGLVGRGRLHVEGRHSVWMVPSWLLKGYQVGSCGPRVQKMSRSRIQALEWWGHDTTEACGLSFKASGGPESGVGVRPSMAPSAARVGACMRRRGDGASGGWLAEGLRRFLTAKRKPPELAYASGARCGPTVPGYVPRKARG